MQITRGSKVFITGAASGIGQSTAVAAARLGAKLFLTDRNGKGLEETAAMVLKNGGEVCANKVLDVTSYEDIKAFADEIHRSFGPLDVLMNIAGIALFALPEDMTHGHFKKVIDVNLWGPIHTIECFVPEMIRAKKGHIVNVASLAGLIGLPWHSAYSASKAGLVRLSEVLRVDLRQHKIGVTVVCPGAVETPLKQTVEILGVDASDPKFKALKDRFSQHAVSPDKVASQILSAMKKNKFMVITSFDVKFFYYCKHHHPLIYNYVLNYASNLMNSGRYPDRQKS
jgi:NAD(P)-dependent dehydrogenase (short-subunit alcohol dehydrogenase family)